MQQDKKDANARCHHAASHLQGMRDEVDALKRKLEDRSAAASSAAQVGLCFGSALLRLLFQTSFIAKEH